MRAIVLIDGEHYAPVVRDALAALPYDVVGALFVVVGALVILGTLAVTFSVFVGSRCACAATPTPRDPNWTPTPPPPFSPADAATRASKLAGVSWS